MGNRDIEGPLHRAILAFLRLRFPAALIHHSANEIGLSGPAVARQIAKAKSNGMMPGWPDIEVINWAHMPVLFFEVKAPGGSITPAQRHVHEQLDKLGHKIAVVKSIDDVQAKLAEWGI